ncbi:hypothetical protein FTO70_11785 [Methanosarcina sp. KYL-1]|uniref:DUF7524 family protein n=1 Tax=Methanosarcina sp. KYL-1 TaxID=2602068 RepID=UPI0021016CB6|nr:hypothetical protein [Methanosarcina sp. KYL-1]MCQ1536347.1 hypothetical protein [Methanosarcina sp. KYL-1]
MQQIFQNVIINRQELNSIEFEKEGIEIPLSPGEDQTFEILISNHGSPTHIHLSVSDELKGQITFLRDNPYVLQKEYVSAVARIPHDGRVLTKGQIFITAGYGSKKKGFPVQLGRVEKPKESPDDEIQIWEENDEMRPYRPSAEKPAKKAPRQPGENGLLVSILKKLTGNPSTSHAHKNPRRNVEKDEKFSLTMAMGGFLVLVFLFFLYLFIPGSSEYSISFTQALLFSILFITCITYILLRIMDEG